MNSSTDEIALKILMIGDSGVGKSRLVHLQRLIIYLFTCYCL